MPISPQRRELFRHTNALDKLSLLKTLLDSGDLNSDSAFALLNVSHAELSQRGRQESRAYIRYGEMMGSLQRQMPQVYRGVIARWEASRLGIQKQASDEGTQDSAEEDLPGRGKEYAVSHRVETLQPVAKLSKFVRGEETEELAGGREEELEVPEAEEAEGAEEKEIPEEQEREEEKAELEEEEEAEGETDKKNELEENEEEQEEKEEKEETQEEEESTEEESEEKEEKEETDEESAEEEKEDSDEKETEEVEENDEQQEVDKEETETEVETESAEEVDEKATEAAEAAEHMEEQEAETTPIDEEELGAEEEEPPMGAAE